MKLTEKLIKGILSIVEKRIEKIVYIKRAYSENVMVTGFHSVRFFADLGQIIFLGNNSVKNKRKIDNMNNKLLQECRKQVDKDIQEYMEEIKKIQKKKKKNKQ